MAEVSLYDRQGNANTHSVGKGIRMYTEDGAVQDFFPGNAEDVTVNLDFSEGDMVIIPSEDTLFEKIIIQKPANLIPENIAKDANVAGIIGNLASGGAVLEGDIFKHTAYCIDDENKEIVIYGVLWTKMYENTGEYDLVIPANCGEYRVVLNAQGVM